MHHAKSLGLALVLVACSAAVGCMAKPRFMRESVAAAPVAAADGATVVFVRPSSYGGVSTFSILDEHGDFVGESAAKSWFAVRVKPGRHVFIAVGENTAPMVANVDAGKLYFVEVASKMGVWTGPRVHLLRLAPGTDNWSQVSSWLAKTTHYEPSGPVTIAPEEREKRVHRAKEHLANYDAEELAERTLRPEDGVVTLGAK